MSASSGLGYVISCFLEPTSDSIVVLVLVIACQSLLLKFSEQNESQWVGLRNLWADLLYLKRTASKCIPAVNRSRPKADYTMHFSETWLLLYLPDLRHSVTPSNLFCGLMIKVWGRHQFKALQNKTIWRGPDFLCCTEIILFEKTYILIHQKWSQRSKSPQRIYFCSCHR